MRLFLLQGTGVALYSGKMLKLLIVSIALLCPALSNAEGGDTWADVRSLYDSGKADDAVLLLKKNPQKNAAYYYNLGTIYLRTQRPGMALPYLEKAYQMNPLDSDVRHNLEAARNQVVRVIGSDRLDPASTPMDLFADRLALGPARAAFSLICFALLILSARAYLRNRSIRTWITHALGPIGALGMAVVLAFGIMPQWVGARPAGFAAERLVIRSGPGERFFELGRLEAGTKVRLLDSAKAAANPTPQDTDNLWYQVRFSGDSVGWIQASHLLIL